MIESTALGVEGSQIKIGIAAPREVGVHRQEVYERVPGARVKPQAPAEALRTQ